MDLMIKVWEKLIAVFADFSKFVKLSVWTCVDRFVPEAREGYPYMFWDVIASVGATTYNNAYPAASFTNATADEFVVEYFRFEAGTDDGIYATGGTAGSYPGANDWSIRARIKDLSNNADMMATAIPLGLLVEPQTRKWYPSRRVVLRGGQNAALQITVDNTSGSSINNVYCAVFGHMRTRKNLPQ